MQPWQERVVQERRELDEKIDRLTTFLSTAPGYRLEEWQRSQMRTQLVAMREYSAALAARIAGFEPGSQIDELRLEVGAIVVRATANGIPWGSIAAELRQVVQTLERQAALGSAVGA